MMPHNPRDILWQLPTSVLRYQHRQRYGGKGTPNDYTPAPFAVDHTCQTTSNFDPLATGKIDPAEAHVVVYDVPRGTRAAHGDCHEGRRLAARVPLGTS